MSSNPCVGRLRMLKYSNGRWKTLGTKSLFTPYCAEAACLALLHSARKTNCAFCGLKEKNIPHLSLSLCRWFSFSGREGNQRGGAESIE